MFRNQLKLVWRTLLKNRMTSLINLTGLTIGLTTAILIGLYLANEWQTDRSLPDPDETYRLLRVSSINGEPYDIGITSAPFAPALLQDFPDAIESVVRVLPGSSVLNIDGKLFQEENYYYVDSNFIQFFDFKLLYGDPQTALSQIHSSVLTFETAIKYFGSADQAMGKLIKVDNNYDVQVTGVLEEAKNPTHFKFDILESTHELYQAGWWSGWWNNNLCTYLRLKEEVLASSIESALPKFMDKYFGKDFEKNGSRIDLRLQPIQAVYFESSTRYDPMRHGDQNSLRIFIIAAILLLLVAAANYINLATAQAARRAKEIGVLKTLGSSQNLIIIRSLLESGLLTGLSVLLAFQLTLFTLPYFEQLFGIEIEIYFSPLLIFVILLGVTILMTILSGLYPGLFLAAFKPATVLKGDFAPGSKRSGNMRKGMVIFQYMLSTLLLLSTFIIYKQLDYLRSKDLGFNRDHVLLMDINNPDVYNNKRVFKERLLQDAAIRSVSYSSGAPGGHHDASNVLLREENVQRRMRTCFVDFDYFKTFELQMKAGRTFDVNLASDSTRAAILNERAVADLGLTAEEVLNKEIVLLSFDSVPKRVIGVVRDYHFTSLHSEIEPLVITPMNWRGKIAIKVDKYRTPEAIAAMQMNWALLAPEFPFTFQFLDETLEEQYLSEQRQSRLFQIFAIVAIFIAGLGMFGLASFTTLTRAREIGIRKILGSSISEIITLLTKDFLILVLVASIIACPLAWYFSAKWLSDFAYHISIPIWVFGAVVMISLIFAGLAIAYHSIKTSLLNPIEVLKDND